MNQHATAGESVHASCYDVLIVGAGHAGGRAALGLRSLGFVGSIGLIGDESTAPYQRPPLSKGFLTGDGDASSCMLVPIDEWAKLGIELHLGVRAAGLDRPAHQLLLEDGRSIGYGRLVLATGLRARPLQLPGTLRIERVLRTLDDARALRSELVAGHHLVIVGGGLIGLELASSAIELGLRVSVIEAGERLLSRWLPVECSGWLASWHRRRGVDLRFTTQVLQCDGHTLHLDDGAKLDADTIVSAIGSSPNVELAAAAGLGVDDGILVDASLRTTDPSIYAIGDVARTLLAGAKPSRNESWRNAEVQARDLGAVLCGQNPEPAKLPWFWTDQCGRNVQVTGWPCEGRTIEVRGDPEQGPSLVWCLDGDIVRGVIGIDCGGDVRRAQRLITTGERVGLQGLFGPRRGAEPRPVLAARSSV